MAFHLVMAVVLALFLDVGQCQAPLVHRYQCQPPFTDIGGRCVYVDFSTTGSWYDMRTLCQNLGGDLVIIHDACFFEALLDYLGEHAATSGDFWVGATDEGHEGEWLWVDGTPVKMGSPYWGYRSTYQLPDGSIEYNCGLLDDYHYYYMNDGMCGDANPNHPICEQAA